MVGDKRGIGGVFIFPQQWWHKVLMITKGQWSSQTTSKEEEEEKRGRGVVM